MLGSLGSGMASNSEAANPRTPPPRRVFGQPIRLWLYVGLLLTGGLAVVFGPVRVAHGLANNQVAVIPWWTVFLVATAVALASVELPIRKTNVVLTLNDAVIIIAIMSAGPFVTALALACSLGLIQAVRRRKAVQVIFNLGSYLLTIPLYYLVLRVMVQPNAIFSLRSVAGYLVAAVLVSSVFNIEISAAMYLSEGDMAVVKMGLVSSTAVVTFVALVNAVIAMIILVMMVAAPGVLLTLPIPFLLTAAAYRAQIATRRQKTDIENLFAATRILNYSRSVTSGAVDFLNHIAEMFHASLVELTLLPSDPEQPALITRTVDGVATRVMETTSVESLPTGLLDEITRDNILITKRSGASSPMASQIAIGDRSTGMGVVLPAQDNSACLGYLVVTQRDKALGDFRRTDLQLLGTLAKQLAFALQNGRLHEDLARLAGAQDELVQKAFHDPLTGLANRELLVDHLESAFRRAGRTGDLIFLVYIDLDEFKMVNDSLGHGAGDEVLIQVGGRLNKCVRTTDTVARLGGDEFAILLEQATSLPAVERIAQRIVESVRDPFLLANGIANIGASVGVAFTDTTGQTAAQLMMSADSAMYTAKKSGKGRHYVSR